MIRFSEAFSAFRWMTEGIPL